MTSLLFLSINSVGRSGCCCGSAAMEMRNAMMSCVLIMMGVILGVTVNYNGMLFDSVLQLQLPVTNAVQ